MKDTDAFPERLRAARELRGMNQTDLSQKAKIPASSISHFEAGSRKPSFDSLRRLANALEVTTDYLLGRVDDIAASGATGDQLYRDLQNMSAGDRDLLKDMMKTLSNRSKGK